jgi:S-methylmethionine-dependent homocysteine/selenocysteine methylase
VRLTLPHYHEWKALVHVTEKMETPLSIQLSPLEER